MENMQQQINMLLDQVQKLNTAKDASGGKLARLDDYEAFQNNFMDLKKKFDEWPEAQSGGSPKREHHLHPSTQRSCKWRHSKAT